MFMSTARLSLLSVHLIKSSCPISSTVSVDLRNPMFHLLLASISTSNCTQTYTVHAPNSPLVPESPTSSSTLVVRFRNPLLHPLLTPKPKSPTPALPPTKSSTSDICLSSPWFHPLLTPNPPSSTVLHFRRLLFFAIDLPCPRFHPLAPPNPMTRLRFIPNYLLHPCCPSFKPTVSSKLTPIIKSNGTHLFLVPQRLLHLCCPPPVSTVPPSSLLLH